MMNKKGLIGILPMLGISFFVVILLPIVLFWLSGLSKVLFQVIMAFTIIGYVKQMGLDGALMWIVSGILIYFIVWKYIYIFSSLYMLMLLMGMGVTSAIMWGTSNIRGKLVARDTLKKSRMGRE